MNHRLGTASIVSASLRRERVTRWKRRRQCRRRRPQLVLSLLRSVTAHPKVRRWMTTVLPGSLLHHRHLLSRARLPQFPLEHPIPRSVWQIPRQMQLVMPLRLPCLPPRAWVSLDLLLMKTMIWMWTMSWLQWHGVNIVCHHPLCPQAPPPFVPRSVLARERALLALPSISSSTLPVLGHRPIVVVVSRVVLRAGIRQRRKGLNKKSAKLKSFVSGTWASSLHCVRHEGRKRWRRK